ncbi:tetratricopeptide repeat protein [Terriglobus albidus]|uniref:tetratricopeptide repeat protein n=1 Tax=Terriglobus albidus TaxID=1592106 RepID=UPI0021E0ECFF|nr:tetratricopeptide repeat protein [Terriglobus albidus]
MNRLGFSLISIVIGLALQVSAAGENRADTARETTAGVIAIANLDAQIAQVGNSLGAEDLLLARARFLADYDALERASALTELQQPVTAQALLQRARTRAALHRFSDALHDVESAEAEGADRGQTVPLRASILIATGSADKVSLSLEAEARQHPGLASRTMLATAYAMLGRVREADQLYAAALADLHTTLPFPYAWICFARALMWADQGQDLRRAEAFYRQALGYLPEFAAANINLAEIEATRGETQSAIERLEGVIKVSDEPEAYALLGSLHLRAAHPEQGRREIEHARQRFELLLGHAPLAFADHAAEFYLGAGHDAERAWELALQNLHNRETDRSVALAVKAALVCGRQKEAETLLWTHGPSVGIYLQSLDRTLPR